MTLAVLGKEPLDELRAMVTERFQSVKSTGRRALRGDEHGGKEMPFRPQDFVGVCWRVPSKDYRQVTFAWQLPEWQVPLFKTKPGNYASHVLGHEGPGSLLSALKASGWATALSAGVSDFGSFSQFQVSISLTEEGVEQIQEIGRRPTQGGNNNKEQHQKSHRAREDRCCDILVISGCSSGTLFAICCISDPLALVHEMPLAALLVALGCNFATICLQSVSLLTASCKATAQAYRRSDAAMVWTAVCLVVNAILVVAGPALSWASLNIHLSGSGVSWEGIALTVDVCFQVLNTLLLSGMIGTQHFDLKEFRRLAEVSGFGLASNRIAFPGKINPAAKDCIVSFPGKYSAEWDAAAQAAMEETSTCSLACVFLTDTASGLGQHAKLPDKPEECWCHVIYGYHPASAYLSVVDVKDLELKEGETEATALAFKEKDAKAMGQCLLIKRCQTELEWQIELAEALVHAEQLCYRNKGRAPWGCMWFEAWRKKVEEAVQLNQKLHVFYFKDQCGKGKLAWKQLCDPRAKETARKDTGLGASQTAEVAYLEKEGIPFEEHDINAFTELIAPNSSATSGDAKKGAEKS
eukprot:symbB.v1.2.005049.t1/scaffold291.1/size238869/14